MRRPPLALPLVLAAPLSGGARARFEAISVRPADRYQVFRATGT